MKQLLLLAVCAIMALSCDDKKATFDPNTRMVINPESQSKVLPSAPYSVDTIVRYAMEMSSTRPDDSRADTIRGRREITKHDLVNKKLTVGDLYDVLMYIENEPQLGWVITDDTREFVITAWQHENGKEWIDAHAVIDLGHKEPASNGLRDTIGYIPSVILEKAKADITNAFNAENYDLCSALFEEAFTFVPITGEQWREKKANGTL